MQFDFLSRKQEEVVGTRIKVCVVCGKDHATYGMGPREGDAISRIKFTKWYCREHWKALQDSEKKT